MKTAELPGGLLEDFFDTTVKMSTYLVAFIVSDFLSVSRTSQHGVNVRTSRRGTSIFVSFRSRNIFKDVIRFHRDSHQISIYAVPEKIDQTAFALDAAVKLLDFYEDYFDIPYPLPKQGW